MYAGHKTFSFKHKCDLPEDLNQKYIARVSPYANPISKCWAHFKNYTTISPNHPLSKTYFKSRAGINKEVKRHLGTKKYRNVIHPFSVFNQIKHVVVCFVWLLSFICDPFFNVFLRFNTSGVVVKVFKVWTIFSCVIFTIDIIMRFYTGHELSETRQVMLDPKQIRKKYLLTYFVVDFVPVVVSFALLCIEIPTLWESLIYQFCYIRFFRIGKTLYKLNEFLLIVHMPDTWRTCLTIIIVEIIVIHWWSCVLGTLPILRKFFGFSEELSWATKAKKCFKIHKFPGAKVSPLSIDNELSETYINHMAAVIIHFYGVGIGFYRTEDPTEMLIFCLVLICGFVFYLFCAAVVLQLFGVTDICESKYDRLFSQINKYTTTMKFPQPLKKRITQYYDYKFHKKFFSEDKILGTLSEHLQMEILLYSCKNLVTRVEIFKGLSRSAIGGLLALLEQEIYLNKDEVLTPPNDDGTIYFILHGTCAVTYNDSEIFHVEDGNHFGDFKYFIHNVDRECISFIAVETSEIYSLNPSNMRYCCKTYPEIALKLREMASQRWQVYYDAIRFAENLKEVCDIAGELRIGNILEQRIKRI